MRAIAEIARRLFAPRAWGLAVALCCVALAGVRAETAATERVVNIYADLGFARGKAVLGQGTGFLVGADGTVVTAYHVVRGARGLTVWDGRSNKFDGDAVQILAIDPEHDLALLRLVGRMVHPHFELSLNTPTRADSLAVIGNFRGMKAHRLATRPTEPTGIARQSDAGSTAGRGGRVDIVPLDLSVLTGMTGAPVLAANDRAVGLLSGSAKNSGGSAWAIPAKYIARLLEEAGEPRPVAAMSWPASGGRGAGRGNPRREYVGNAEAANAVTRYHETFEELQSVTASLTHAATPASQLVREACATVEDTRDHLTLNYGWVDIWRLNDRLDRRELPDGLGGALREVRSVLEARGEAEAELRELIDVFEAWIDSSDLEGDDRLAAMEFRDEVAVRYNGIAQHSYEDAVGLDPAALRGFLGRLGDGLPRFESDQAASRYVKTCRAAASDLARYGWMHESGSRVAEHHLFDAYAELMRRFEQYFTGMPVN